MKKLIALLLLIPTLALSQTNNFNILDNTSSTISGGTINNTVIGGTTPAAGTFTTVNKVTITQPATSATLTIANGKTLTASKTLTLDGTDSTTMTFPATSATIARTDAANVFTGDQSMSGFVAIGTTPSTTRTLYVAKANTGGTTAIGVRSDGTFQSDVTTAGKLYQAVTATQATSFTLTDLMAYSAEQGSVGAGSAITNQYGFYASNTLSGATNNYGFYSNIASGSARFNFFSNGTADNAFTGNVRIGSGTAPTTQLDVTGSALLSSFVGIGTSVPTDAAFKITKGVTGATMAFGSNITSTIASDVTAQAVIYNSAVSTQATSFTLTSLYDFEASQGTIGAGSTVTNHAGFVAASNMTGATNNYGFLGVIPSGSNRWNFYANGTANNAFAGNSRFGSTTAPVLTVDITGTLGVSGAVTMPGLASSSAATTGTLCWTTGTGNVNVDTTVACLASTIRVKEHVQLLDIGLKQIMRMRPVSYDLKPEFNPEHLGHQVGLVAEEVAMIDDRLVAKDSKGDPRGVRYMQMTAVIIKAMQEQQKQIVKLQKELKQLSHRVNH